MFSLLMEVSIRMHSLQMANDEVINGRSIMNKGESNSFPDNIM